MNKLLIVVIALWAPQLLGSCPAGLFSEELRPGINGPRDKMKLFVKQNPAKEKVFWKEIPLQVDPVDEEGRLMFFEDEAWRKESLGKSDLLSFKAEEFGQKINYSNDVLPCRGPVTFQIRDKYARKYAYLTNCSLGKNEIIHPELVSFEPDKNLIVGKNYKYVFNSKNYMQFKTIGFTSKRLEKVDKTKAEIASTFELMRWTHIC